MKSKMEYPKLDKELMLDIPLKGDFMQYTGLQVHKLPAGKTISATVAPDEEVCVVLVSGYADIHLNNELYENIGNRMTAFVKQPPYALYVTANDKYEFKANTDVELAICSSHGKGTYKSRLIEPDMNKVEERGYGQIQRTAKNILPEDEDADSLLVVEVITEGGNWSSFPSHRHDEDDLPNQSYLEEIYYHKLNPPVGGFAFQRVYNDDKSVNDTYTVENGCAVLLKEGYHPVSVPPGYSLYYLNVMAGPKRTWKFYNEPYFEHLIK